MTNEEYLKQVLKDQTLDEDSAEIAELNAEKDAVEKVLMEAFPNSTLKIKHGGSRAKGTMIKESYDLDLPTYFEEGDTAAGDSLKEIFDTVAKKLEPTYIVEKKTSALRLVGKGEKNKGKYTHIDVVPGRYIDTKKAECFIHQNGAEKERLKTNLKTHILHIRDSGETDAIRLFKLWKYGEEITLKTFVAELLVVKILAEDSPSTLEKKFTLIMESLDDATESPSVEDPANTNNDLSSIWSDQVKSETAEAAKRTLKLIKDDKWQEIFGEVETSRGQQRIEVIRQAASTIANPAKPHST